MAIPAAVGQVYGGRLVFPVPVAANQSFLASGGKFVVISSSYAYIATTGSYTAIVGWADAGEFVSSSTAGGTEVPVNFAQDAVYEIPVNSTLTETQCKARLGMYCDIISAGGAAQQQAGYATSTGKTLQIVGYRYYGAGGGEQTLLVKRSTVNNTSFTSVS